jgi:hypothetical protein
VSKVCGSSELRNPERGERCKTGTGSDGEKTRDELGSASRAGNSAGQRRTENLRQISNTLLVTWTKWDNIT